MPVAFPAGCRLFRRRQRGLNGPRSGRSGGRSKKKKSKRSGRRKQSGSGIDSWSERSGESTAESGTGRERGTGSVTGGSVTGTGKGKGTGNEAGRGTAETPSATAGAGVGAHLCGTGVGAASWESSRESCRHQPPCSRGGGSRPQRDRYNLFHAICPVLKYGCHLSPHTKWSSGHLPPLYPITYRDLALSFLL